MTFLSANWTDRILQEKNFLLGFLQHVSCCQFQDISNEINFMSGIVNHWDSELSIYRLLMLLTVLDCKKQKGPQK